MMCYYGLLFLMNTVFLVKHESRATATHSTGGRRPAAGVKGDAGRPEQSPCGARYFVSLDSFFLGAPSLSAAVSLG